MSSTEWRERLYSRTFDEILEGLEAIYAEKGEASLEQVRGALRHLYILEGNDQGGRGEREDAVLRAQVAAHEAFLHARDGASGWK